MRRSETALYVVAAAAAIAWWAARAGTGLVYNDSYQYVSVADSLRRSGEAATTLVHFDVEREHGRIPAPLTSFPPGYPAAIAALSFLGLPAPAAGFAISAAAFVAVLLLLRTGGAALGLGATGQRVTMLAWLVNAHASEYGATVLAESLFAALATAAVVLLLPSGRPGRAGRRAVLAGALLGAAYWTRYAGIFLAAAFDAYAAWQLLRDRGRRAAWACALAVCDVVVAAGMARNVLVAGSWRGGNVRFTPHPLVGRLRDLAVAQVSLVLGGISARPLFRAAALLVAVAAAAAAVRFALRAARTSPRAGALSPVALLLAFVATYVAGVFYAALATDISFGARLFTPILPAILLLAGALAAAFPAPSPATPPRPRWAAWPAALFAVGYLGTNVDAMAADRRVAPHLAVAEMLDAPGPDGAPLHAWIDAHVPQDAVLVAASGQATGHLLHRRTVSAVSGEYSGLSWDEDETRREMARFGARHVIVFADRARLEGSPDSEFLRRLAARQPPGWLELAADNGSALVYRVRTAPASGGGESPGAPCLAAPRPAANAPWVPAIRSGPARGLADPLARVAPGAPAAEGATSSACLAAARGEHEAFTIVVPGGERGRRRVTLAASDLVGPGGARIRAREVQLFREVYTKLPAASTCGYRDRCGKDDTYGNRSLGPGTYADGLVPFALRDGSRNDLAAPFDVAAGANQPIWIEVLVPRAPDAPPGRYAGQITIASPEDAVTVPLALTVWDFELPVTPSEKTAFNVGGTWNGRKNFETPACMEFLLLHKISPQWLRPTDGPAQARDLALRLGLTATEPRGFGTTYADCRIRRSSGDRAPPASEFAAAERRYPPGVTLYVWTADEIGGKSPDNGACYYGDIVAWAQAMHSGSRFKQLITMYPAPELLDDRLGTGRSAVDIWSPSAFDFHKHGRDPAFVAARKKGDEFWPYWSLAGDPFAPRVMIDFPPANNRQMVGFIAASVGAQGALFWQVDSWTRDYPRVPVNPWREVPVYVNDDGDTGYGDGALVYPGDDVGAGPDCFAPTLRLKWIREGIEDYEYAQLARAAGVPNWLELVRIAALDYQTWTKDPAVLAQARLALGQALHARWR